MVVTVAIRKVDGIWKGALVAEGKFIDSFAGKNLDTLIENAIGGYLRVEGPDGAEVTLNLAFSEPEGAQMEKKEQA